MKLTNYLVAALLPAMTSLSVFAAPGQADTAKPAAGGYVVLVALHAERNRIEAAKKSGNETLRATLEKDAEETRKRTIMDFNDNFHSFPVYFIMDTDIVKIARGKKEDVLMNADGSKVKGTPPSFAANQFVIAYYNHSDVQYLFEDVIVDSERWKELPMTRNYSLVLYNNKFQQFNSYTKHAFATLDEDQEKYYYKSKVCDMEYYPYAHRMEARRNKRKGVTTFFGF